MEEARKQRVKFLKKLILILLLLLLLLPTVLCIVLFGKIASLENQLIEIVENKSDRIEELAMDEKREIHEIDVDQILNQREQQKVVVEDNRQKVYLTFDDGPSYITNEVLDILKEYDVKATFFVVGKPEEKYHAIYKRIVDEGHSIGLHTYSHVYSEVYESVEAYAEDLEKIRVLVEDVTGVSPTIVRFPGGSSNTASKVDMSELIIYLEENGMTYYDWNATMDSVESSILSVTEMVEKSTYGLENQHTVMILMHDSANQSYLIQALPLIIEKILATENSVILPITEETIPIQHIIS